MIKLLWYDLIIMNTNRKNKFFSSKFYINGSFMYQLWIQIHRSVRARTETTRAWKPIEVVATRSVRDRMQACRGRASASSVGGCVTLQLMVGGALRRPCLLHRKRKQTTMRNQKRRMLVTARRNRALGESHRANSRTDTVGFGFI